VSYFVAASAAASAPWNSLAMAALQGQVEFATSSAATHTCTLLHVDVQLDDECIAILHGTLTAPGPWTGCCAHVAKVCKLGISPNLVRKPLNLAVCLCFDYFLGALESRVSLQVLSAATCTLNATPILMQKRLHARVTGHKQSRDPSSAHECPR
jgi:hypothetical protein